MKKLTPEEFAERMKEIVDKYAGNQEAVHEQMDQLMGETLIALGYHEGIKIFNSTPKWYA